MTEQEILERYSTPGLRRNVLTRAGKKWHLQDFARITPEEIEAVLDQLYPPEPAAFDAVAKSEAA
jgi:hypothetical protein